MTSSARIVLVSLGLALLSFGVSGCAVDRSGAARVGVDGSVGARDGGRRDDGGDRGLDDGSAGDDGGPIVRDDGASGGDGGSSTDSGSIGADAGPAPDVEFEVRVDGTTCPALTSCGGEVEGAWQVSGGCVDFGSVASLLRTLCSGATITGIAVANGRISFSGGMMQRDLRFEGRGAVGVPAGCASLAGGCPGAADQIRRAVPGLTVTCAATPGGACDCPVTLAPLLVDEGPYRIDGNQIVRTSDGRRWDYCVSGTSLRYRETTGTLEPGTFAFTRL
jgi:hypothetical protein